MYLGVTAGFRAVASSDGSWTADIALTDSDGNVVWTSGTIALPQGGGTVVVGGLGAHVTLDVSMQPPPMAGTSHGPAWMATPPPVGGAAARPAAPTAPPRR